MNSDLLLPTAAESWPRVRIDSCADFEPRGEPEVVEVESFDLRCAGALGFQESVIVLFTKSEGFFGSKWKPTTKKWRVVDGVQVHRRYKGTEFSLGRLTAIGLWAPKVGEYAAYLGPDADEWVESLGADQSGGT